MYPAGIAADAGWKLTLTGVAAVTDVSAPRRAAPGAAVARKTAARARRAALRRPIHLDAVDRRIVDHCAEDQVQRAVTHGDVVDGHHVRRVRGAGGLDDVEVCGDRLPFCGDVEDAVADGRVAGAALREVEPQVHRVHSWLQRER